MHLKTTIGLLFLAGGCVALFLFGPELAPRLGLASKPTSVRDDGTARALAELPVEKVAEIEIQAPDQPKLVLKAPAAGKPLELPGNWPIRRSEVDELFGVLRDLKSRYQPIAIDDKTDLKPYGLLDEQKPVVVKITTGDATETFRFGEAPLQAGENPFTRATYVRLEGKNELLRLGPQVMPILRRNEETYRRRQLFPEAVRERIAQPKPPRIPGMPEDQPAAAQPTFVLGDAAKRIAIESPSGKVVLQREAPMPKPEPPADKPDDDAVVQPIKLAGSWFIVEPVRDRIDPEKLRTLLTAIPNIWLERFVDQPLAPDFAFGLGSQPDALKQLVTFLGGSIPTGIGETPLSTIVNLASLPEAQGGSAKLTVTLQDGSRRTLQIGRVSRADSGDEFRFAKIEDNPLVFEIKADKLGDLQIALPKPRFGAASSPVDDLRDPLLAHFDTGNVKEIDIASKAGKVERILTMQKTGDEWTLTKPYPEPAYLSEITSLLNFLKDMDARKGSIIDGPLPQLAVVGGLGALDPKTLLGLTPDRTKKVTLSFDAKIGAKPIAYLIGKRDSVSGKRAVIVEGSDRINIVNDPSEPDRGSRLDRAPSSYRVLKLYDPIKNKIGEIVIQRAATAKHPADSVTLQEQAGSPPKWTIAAPFKAETDREVLSPLTNDLFGLATRKYVYDSKTDDPLVAADVWPRILVATGALGSAVDPTSDAFFGLDKPTLAITLKFKGPKGAEDVVIEIGRAKSPKEFYARRKGTTGIFVVPDAIAKTADNKAEDLVDRTLIQFSGDSPIQAIRRSMDGKELEIAQNNSALWEITKPVVAKTDQTIVDELAKQLGRLRAVRIETLVPKDLKTYGLDKPAATVTIEALQKSKLVERSLLIGALVEPKKPDGERFAKVEGSSAIAVIPGPLSKQLLADPLKFRDANLGGFISGDKIAMEHGDRKLAFVKGSTGWKVKEPVEADAEDEDLRELHDALAKIRADEFVADKPSDLSKYGLDKPAHWRVYNGDKEVLHLLVGSREKIGTDKKTDGPRAYAMLDKGNAVVLLNPALSAKLSAEYRKRSLWEPPQAKDVTELSIKSADGKESLVFSHGPLGWIDLAKPTEKLNPKLVDDLLFTAALLRIDRYVSDKAADLKPFGLDKPRTLTIILEGGKKHSILLGSLFEGKHLYAKSAEPNRSDVFLLGEEDSRVLNRGRDAYTLKAKDEPKKEVPKKDGKEEDKK